MKLLSFGEIIWDVYPDRRALGGAPLNFAIHFAARGGSAYMLSAVGDDDLGREALALTEKRGVHTDFVLTGSAPTGRCDVTLDENKVPSYNLMRDTAYDLIELSDECLTEISESRFDALCFGTLIQRNCVSRSALAALLKAVTFDTVFCDVNLRKGNYDAESVLFCLQNATVLKVSREEAPALTELSLYPTPSSDSPKALADSLISSFKNISTVLITDGENGAYCFTREGESTFSPSKKVNVVSTVGAGDSFGAAWLASFSTGAGYAASLSAATDYAADVISGKA